MYIVECKSDAVLVTELTGCPRKDIIHARGKGSALRLLEKLEDAVALVDEDPGSPWPKSIREYSLRLELKEGIVILSSRRHTRKLILL